MAHVRYLVLFTTVLCSVSCLKVFPIEGTTVTLVSGFVVKSSLVVPPVFTTGYASEAAVDSSSISDEATLESTSLPRQVPTTFEMKTDMLSLVMVQPPTVFATIEPTPKLAAIKNEPSAKVTMGIIDDIAPTSVVKVNTLQTFDIPANHLRPPKVLGISKPRPSCATYANARVRIIETLVQVDIWSSTLALAIQWNNGSINGHF